VSQSVSQSVSHSVKEKKLFTEKLKEIKRISLSEKCILCELKQHTYYLFNYKESKFKSRIPKASIDPI
jgi:hypothetical protein